MTTIFDVVHLFSQNRSALRALDDLRVEFLQVVDAVEARYERASPQRLRPGLLASAALALAERVDLEHAAAFGLGALERVGVGRPRHEGAPLDVPARAGDAEVAVEDGHQVVVAGREEVVGKVQEDRAASAGERALRDTLGYQTYVQKDMAE